MIRIRVTDDGTYTVYRDGHAMVTGLTREQAYAAAQSLNTVVVDQASPTTEIAYTPSIRQLGLSIKH